MNSHVRRSLAGLFYCKFGIYVRPDLFRVYWLRRVMMPFDENGALIEGAHTKDPFRRWLPEWIKK